jgi:hypothetical protein
MERLAAESDRKLESVSRPEMEALWESAKRNELKRAAHAAESKR